MSVCAAVDPERFRSVATVPGQPLGSKSVSIDDAYVPCVLLALLVWARLDPERREWRLGSRRKSCLGK